VNGFLQRLRLAAQLASHVFRAEEGSVRQMLMEERGWGGGKPTFAGVPVSAESAMRLTAVNACVRVLAETLASLPLKLYRERGDGGKEPDVQDPLYKLLYFRPNAYQTSFQWREEKMTHLAFRGHGYDYISRVRGRVDELLPIHPDRVRRELLTSGEMLYHVSPDSNAIIARTSPQTFTAREIFHLQGFNGRSVISDAREAIGMTAAQEIYGAKLYANGAHFSGVATHPAKLSDTARDNMRKSWHETYGGATKAHGLLILEEGVKYEKISMSAVDAQFLEARRFQVAEIARMFRVPLHMLAELDRSTNNNIEQQAREFVTFTMLPWLVRWEQDIQAQLVADSGQQFAKFGVDALLRGDAAARATYYRYGRQDGWLNPNEVRAREDYNPRKDPGGESYDPPNITAQRAGYPQEAVTK
jgi:HK97 family phage portal protein